MVEKMIFTDDWEAYYTIAMHSMMKENKPMFGFGRHLRIE